MTRINLIAVLLDTPLAYPAGHKTRGGRINKSNPKRFKAGVTLESERHAHTLTRTPACVSAWSSTGKRKEENGKEHMAEHRHHHHHHRQHQQRNNR